MKLCACAEEADEHLRINLANPPPRTAASALSAATSATRPATTDDDTKVAGLMAHANVCQTSLHRQLVRVRPLSPLACPPPAGNAWAAPGVVV